MAEYIKTDPDPKWDEVRSINRDDSVTGAETGNPNNGIVNIPHVTLANRTERNRLDILNKVNKTGGDTITGDIKLSQGSFTADDIRVVGNNDNIHLRLHHACPNDCASCVGKRLPSPAFPRLLDSNALRLEQHARRLELPSHKRRKPQNCSSPTSATRVTLVAPG